MKHLSILFILSFVCSSPSLAVVELLTTIRDIVADGRDETAGEIAIFVSGDDFAAAGPNNPVFIRIRLDHGARLSRTLVDLEKPQSPHRPIYLALRIDDEEPGNPPTINAPADTLSIVRWRRGESAIWLRVNHSSSLWILRNGTPQPPNIALQVGFQFGSSVESSLNFAGFAAVMAGLANLPVNQYKGGAFADTTLRVDLLEANLQPIPASPGQSLLNLDIVAFALNFQDLITFPDPSLIVTTQLPVAFSGGNELARAVSYSPDRWLFHITRVGAGFTSTIILQNLSGQRRMLGLHPFDIDGFPLGQDLIEIEPGEILKEPVVEFFNSTEISHVRISGHQSVAASVAYRVETGPGLTAHLRESRDTHQGFLIYPVDPALGFDGLAAVNTGDAPANVRLEFLDFAGQVNGEVDLTATETFPVNSKKLWVVSVFSEEPEPAAMRLVSDQPLGTVFLRGNHNGQGSLNLFELTPIRLLD